MATAVRAVASYRGLPIEHENSLVDVAVPVPDPRPHDVVAAVQAVSANPADVKRRATLTPGDAPTLLGYDTAGLVQAIGPEISTLALAEMTDRIEVNGPQRVLGA